MPNAYSMDDLLEFLNHASDRGLMPVSTAQALAVATRNVLGVLTDEERTDVGSLDLDAVIKRFMNKRAKEFNPSSLKEYARRLHRAVGLYTAWKDDPANFSIKTRATVATRKKDLRSKEESPTDEDVDENSTPANLEKSGYRSAFPIRPGTVVTLLNLPSDLTAVEAERLAQFVKMLAIQ